MVHEYDVQCVMQMQRGNGAQCMVHIWCGIRRAMRGAHTARPTQALLSHIGMGRLVLTRGHPYCK